MDKQRKFKYEDAPIPSSVFNAVVAHLLERIDTIEKQLKEIKGNTEIMELNMYDLKGEMDYIEKKIEPKDTEDIEFDKFCRFSTEVDRESTEVEKKEEDSTKTENNMYTNSSDSTQRT